jgi:hypothetical protein
VGHDKRSRALLTTAQALAMLAFVSWGSPLLAQQAGSAEEAKKRKGTGNHVSREECPVIGNTRSMIYHVPGDLGYNVMREQNKNVKKDNRRCFANSADAELAGFRRSQSGSTPPRRTMPAS